MPCVTLCSKPRHSLSWFNSTLFLQNFGRFWPVWVLYGAVWLLLLPVGLFNGSAGDWALPSGGYDPNAYLIQSIPAGLFFSPLFGVLSAMAVFSYLFNPRAVGLMHTLPIRREGLFLTNYLSGLGFFLLPILFVAAVTLAVQAYIGEGVAWTALFLWVWCQAMMTLFFFSLACLCAMLTGLLAALPVFFAAANMLVLGLYSLLQQISACFLFGYDASDIPWLSWFLSLFFGYGSSMNVPPWVEWLTPLLCYCNHLGNTGAPDYRLTGLFPIFVYGFLGLVLAGLALLLYRRRQLEAAGDVVAVAWLRPVFRYGVALCSAVAFGSLLWSLIFPSGWSRQALTVLLLFAGAVGYFAAEMLLCKSFRVFRRGWKGCAVFLLLLFLGAEALALDLSGFETRVPQAGQVASVEIDSSLFAPYDSGGFLTPLTGETEIAQAVALHQAVVDQRVELEVAGTPLHEWETRTVDGVPMSVETQGSVSFTLAYTLENGAVLRRSYTIPVTRALLDQPDSPAARLEALLNAPGQARRAYFQGRQDEDVPTSGYLSSYIGEGVSFAGEDLDILYRAVLADLDAGRLGRHYLLEDAEYLQGCYFNDLSFTFRPARSSSAAEEDETYTVVITLQVSASETLQALNDLGATEELLTMAQANA